MADLFDYLRWRGDLSFQQDPPNAVDALIFSTLCYIDFGTAVSSGPDAPVTLREAADEVLEAEDIEDRIRVKQDIPLLRETAASQRFGQCRVLFYRNFFNPQEDTQFAAMTFLPDDRSAFLTFRGTDDTLVGWKEDFNMAFQDVVPAQELALDYTLEFAKKFRGPLYLGGHSKGGNLAVYAAAKAGKRIQKRIVRVYSMDGPGFREHMMGDPGYLEIVPKCQTYVPQSSVIGMLLEHEEPYTVIKSRRIGGLLQHESYSWEVEGRELVPMEGLTAESRLVDEAITQWLSTMTLEQRNKVVDTLFTLLESGNVESARDILHPKNLRNYVRTLIQDEETRKLLGGEFMTLLSLASRLQLAKETEWLSELKLLTRKT